MFTFGFLNASFEGDKADPVSDETYKPKEQ